MAAQQFRGPIFDGADSGAMATDGADEPDSNPIELTISSKIFYAVAAMNGKITLMNQAGEVIGGISGLRVGNIKVFFQQPMDIFHRTFHNVFYLWVVYDHCIDLVYCDAKDGFDITVGMTSTTLSFFRPEGFGYISKFDLLDSQRGKGSLVIAEFIFSEDDNEYVNVVPIDAAGALYYSEKVRQGDVSAALLRDIDMGNMQYVQLRIPEIGQGIKVTIDELSVRTVGAYHTGLTSDLTVRDWANAVREEICNPGYSFDIMYVDEVQDVYMGSYVCDGQKVVDTIEMNGTNSFTDFDLLVTIGNADLPLWKACMALKLVPIERYAELVALHSKQLGVESDWFRKVVLLEAAVANGLSSIVKDLILAKHTTGSNRGSYLLEDIARVERWVDEYKQNIESQLTDMLEAQISFYLLRKAALSYEPVAGQCSSVPVAVSSALQLRLSIIDSITMLVETLQIRKQNDSLSNTMSYVRLKGRGIHTNRQNVTSFVGTTPLKTPSLFATTMGSVNLAGASATSVGMGTTAGIATGSSNSLDRQLLECNCISSCYRAIMILVKHPNLSLRCFYPSRLPCSYPSTNLQHLRAQRIDNLRSSLEHFIPESCIFQGNILQALIERSVRNLPTAATQQLFSEWDSEGLLIPSHLSESECNKWLASLFLLPLDISRLLLHVQDTFGSSAINTASGSSSSSTNIPSNLCYAYMTVIYQIMDALFVTVMGKETDSSVPINDEGNNDSKDMAFSNMMGIEALRIPGVKTRDRRECIRIITDLCIVLGNAVNLSFAHQRLLLALWKVENNIELDSAIKDLTTGAAYTIIKDDEDLLKQVILKSLAWELHNSVVQFKKKRFWINESFALNGTTVAATGNVDADAEVVLGHGSSFHLISYFISASEASASSLLFNSSLGSIMSIASYLHPQSWEDGWKWVRSFINKLEDSAVRAESARAVTDVLCRWTREFGLFGEFLLQHMNEIEIVIVDKYFMEQLELELMSVETMYESKTIDIYISWLLRFNRYSAAVEINRRFDDAIRNSTPMLDHLPPAVLESMRKRSLIIDSTLQLNAASI